MIKTPEYFMELAINEAKNSGQDIPVGCVIEIGGEIISSFSNKKEALNDPTAHSEILAIKECVKKLNSKYLLECNMYVTLEPCPMCGWAILNSRIKNVYFGAYDEIYGAFGSKINLLNISQFKPKVTGGILEARCKEILLNYFYNIRK